MTTPRHRSSRSEGPPTPLLQFTPSRRVERVWPPLDAFLYNMMTINVVIGFSIPFLAAAAYYPTGSWPLATAASAALGVAEAVVYSFLASSMPRSGGEYYFQGRILSTGIALGVLLHGSCVGGRPCGWRSPHGMLSHWPWPLLVVWRRPWNRTLS